MQKQQYLLGYCAKNIGATIRDLSTTLIPSALVKGKEITPLMDMELACDSSQAKEHLSGRVAPEEELAAGTGATSNLSISPSKL